MELMNLGLAYYLKERYDDSIRVLERSLNRNPNFVNSHIVVAAAYARAGRDRDAAHAAQAVGRLNPFFRIETYGSLFRNPADKEEVAVGLKKAGLE